MGFYQEFNKLAEMIDFNKVDMTPNQEIKPPQGFEDLYDTIKEQEARWGEEREYGN